MTWVRRADVALDLGGRCRSRRCGCRATAMACASAGALERDDLAVGQHQIGGLRCGLVRAAAQASARRSHVRATHGASTRGCMRSRRAQSGWTQQSSVVERQDISRHSRRTAARSCRRRSSAAPRPATPSRVERGDLRLVDGCCQPRGKNDESVPNSRRSGPDDVERLAEHAVERQAGMVLHPAVASSTCRGGCSGTDRRPSALRESSPAPKCGMMTGTVGKRDATAASASGSPSRRSNGDGKPELLPDADGQHAAVHEHRGAVRAPPPRSRRHALIVQPVAVHRREEAHRAQLPVAERARQPLGGVGARRD